MPSRAQRWLSFRSELKRDLLQQTANYLFVFRVFEGIAAWVLFNGAVRGDFSSYWQIHLLFVAYFVVNAFLALQYRNRRLANSLVLADVGLNAGTMTLVAGFTGGLSSPVVLICVMKTVAYGLIFSAPVAALAVLMTVAGFSLLMLGEYLEWWREGIHVLGNAETFDTVIHLVLFAAILVCIVWLCDRMREGLYQSQAVAPSRVPGGRQSDSVPAIARRIDEAQTEAVVLAGVSEALSQFTEAKDILNKVVEIARGVLWWDYCLILLWDNYAQAYICSEVSGFEPERARQLRGLRLSPKDEPDLEWVRKLGHCAVMTPREGARQSQDGAPTLLAAPLYSDGEFYGVLEFARFGGQRGFTQNDLRLADRLVGRTAVALQRARLFKEQQQADRMRAAGELASGVAHEVNNALVGILGQVESVRASSDVAAFRNAIDTVETQAHRIKAIIRELLGFGRPELPERTRVDLRDLVANTLTLMEHELKRANVRVDTRFTPGVPPVLVDRKQIQQVLVNLFTNALHAVESKENGELLVSVHANRGSVYIEVQDNGIGIPDEVISRVFDPFFSTKTKGTGLGLSVSFNIVRAHAGDLTVHSTPGVGTIFTVKLPAASDEKVADVHTALLVDDDPAVAATLEDMLRREGLDVRRAATGQEALNVLERQTFDAIFLDVRLPDISGQEIYARLAERDPEKARRVIFVTGGLWRIESRGLRDQLPPQPMLAKPCTADQIREALRLLGGTRAAA
jgi:signal transduction histidine kinase/ActR/RegA family two-component response regulator